jgi:hypothetical protein
LDSQELKVGSGHIKEPSHWRSWPKGLSRIEGQLRTNTVKSLQSARAGKELKAGSGHIQEPSKCRGWPIGLSRIEGQLRTLSRSFRRGKLANETLKN